MTKERQFLTAEQARKYLAPRGNIHVFLNPGGMLVGSDWSRKEINALLDGAQTIEIGGEQCVRMNHGLVVYKDGRHHFLESTAGKVDSANAQKA